jgi:RND family efflux transporter MFP subunit
MIHISPHLSRSRSCSLAFACALALLLTACSGSHPAGNTQAPVEVNVTMPQLRVFHDEVSAYGQLAADSRNALSLSLPQAGQVVATEVIAGRRVHRGQVLLKLVTDPSARSAYLQAQSALTTARDDLARTERLHAEKLATNTQLDAARKAMADAQAALDAQARLGGAQTVAELHAPSDGVVTALSVQKGQRIPAGTPLVQFTPASALAAQLGVNPGDASGIRTGMRVSIQPVYGSPDGSPLRGSVAMVGDAVNPQTHLVDLVATIDGHARFASGTALSATVQASNFKAWSVPRDAVQSDAQGDYVFQIEHGRARRVDVKVVAPNGSPVGVKGALDPHAPVITLGSYEISDGDAVKAQDAKAGKR